MSTHQFMRSQYPAYSRSAPKAKNAQTPKRRQTPLETALIVAGLAAWSWCAYEVVLLLIR